MNDWKIIPTIVFTTVLIFGAGVFSGGILVDYVKQNHAHMAVRSHPPQPPVQNTQNTNSVSSPNPSSAQTARPVKPPEILSTAFLQRLDTDLHLNKDEHEAIQKIISDGQNEMRKVVQDARLEIREVLTAQQQQQFDDLMKRPFHKPLFTTNAVPAIVSTNATATP